jgi:DNA (cytosine-5)-methyltransferase 1
MGFDAKWGVLGASEVGAKHKRDRIWIVGNSNNQSGLQASEEVNTQRGQWDAWRDIGWKYWERTPTPDWQISETVSDGVLDGLANRVDRLKAIGNGQVPLCAATAWRVLK